MSTTLQYQEPYRFSAGALALAVHLVFFAVLYLGMHWQSRPPEEFAVEMWDALPETVPEQPPAQPVVAEPVSPPKAATPVLPPAKAEIELREKKKKKPEQKPQQARKETAKEKAAARAKREKERLELEAYEASSEQRRQKLQEQMRAESAAATRVEVQSWEDKIRNKIRRKMRMVADVPENAEAIFKVTLLPDGSLMDEPVLLKGSGYPAYDEAAERAILAAEPLPVPTNPELLPMFRELKLSIRP